MCGKAIRVNELTDRHEADEPAARYNLREDNINMRNFIIGESKELGIKVKAADGEDFSITAATYEYKDRSGNLLETGEATVEDKMVYTELTPTVVGFDQIVTFKVTLKPVDVTKNPETVKADVIVNVMKEQ